MRARLLSDNTRADIVRLEMSGNPTNQKLGTVPMLGHIDNAMRVARPATIICAQDERQRVEIQTPLHFNKTLIEPR
jgi:hypothetical protein